MEQLRWRYTPGADLRFHRDGGHYDAASCGEVRFCCDEWRARHVGGVEPLHSAREVGDVWANEKAGRATLSGGAERRHGELCT